VDHTALLPEGEDPLPGTLAGGRFRLLERIAPGGQSILYRAACQSTASEVAVRVFHGESLASPEARASLLRAAELSSALQSRWIARVLGWGALGAGEGPAFLAMELVRGRPLRSLFGGGPVEELRALRLLRRLAAALTHAHERGLVHGRLDGQRVVVADDGGEPDGLRVLGLFRPAEADGDFAADLRAAGALLFQLLTGSAPPPVTEAPPSLREASGPGAVQVSFAVERLAQRLLTATLDSRLTTARDLVRALDDAGARGAVQVPALGEQRPVLPEVPDRLVTLAARALQQSGAALARGQPEASGTELMAAAAQVQAGGGAEAVAARVAAAGEDAWALRAALEDVLDAADAAAAADRPGETERDALLAQVELAGWLARRGEGARSPAVTARMERAFAVRIRERLEARQILPGAVEALAVAEDANASEQQVREALARARAVMEAPAFGPGETLDDATFERLRREAFGNEQNALTRCDRRAEVVAAAQQAIADASESYACGDIGGAVRTYARALERLLAEVLESPSSAELRNFVEQALGESRKATTEEEAAWALRSAFEAVLEMDARVAH
jgi:serine/threonine-protein kinase